MGTSQPPDDPDHTVVCDHVRRLCRSSADDPGFAPLRAWLRDHSYDAAACAAALSLVLDEPSTHAHIEVLKARLREAGINHADGALERWLMLECASVATEHLQTLRVPREVAQAWHDEVAFIAAPPSPSNSAYFTAGAIRFAELCKIVSLRRFPAGQFHWEVSGIARRDLLSVSAAHLPRALVFVATRMRGLAPVFYSHLNARRPTRSLDEDAACRSYHLMARAMSAQPEIRGFAASSWFRAPTTHKVSPHLAWVSRVFLENGGFVADAGVADPDCGVFTRSATRRRLYETGRFKPRHGLVMWPRSAMIAWAANHPEFGDSPKS